ncbi:MAG: hypothetical protein EU536_04320 [Promethearchaeota archaeon]|nr:MAG: hypothetical protein EU536_04320 [Candidatus Lokiarchaeota archaeon]
MLIDFGTRTVQTKIVFYGSALSGKTTALRVLYKQLSSQQSKKQGILSIHTGHKNNNRTLFYDFGVIRLNFGIWVADLNFWTATGQDYYCATRSTVLQGTDGLVFMVDSQRALIETNIKSWSELIFYFGSKLVKLIPVVICLNKRDLLDVTPVHWFRKRLNLLPGTPIFETIAIDNHNIVEAFKALLEGIFRVHKDAKTCIMKQLKKTPTKKEINEWGLNQKIA